MTDPLRRPRQVVRAARDAGQAALVLVLVMAVILLTVGTTLALNAEEHDPLVEEDTIQHFAYRALEAGVDVLLSTLNEQPNFVDCSSARTSQTCKDITAAAAPYDTWQTVAKTTTTTTTVPEHFLWLNPTFCFSTTKVADKQCTSTSKSGNLEFVRITVVGAAGHSGDWIYQKSTVDFAPKNGFLTHVYWSNYNVVYPGLLSTGCPTTGTYNWEGSTKYETEPNCNVVTFIPSDTVLGPIFSNDSLWVHGTAIHTTKKVAFTTPTKTHTSPVFTADPDCLFVASSHSTPSTCATASKEVKYTSTLSKHGTSYLETPPTTDTSLVKLAATGGCLYQGPTVISFFEKTSKPKMHVWSPETPRSGTTDSLNSATNKNVCFSSATTTKTPTTTTVTVPSGRNASTTWTPNGVIYVKTSSAGKGGSGTCAGDGVNPLDAKVQPTAPITTKAQIVPADYYTGTDTGYNFTADVDSKTNLKEADCEGDLFVRDAKTASGETPGITGTLTVAAENNIFVTGNLKYLDCKLTTGSGTWTSKHTCAYNAGATQTNDALGLIATHFVELDRPGSPNCSSVETYYHRGRGGTEITCSSTPTTILGDCTTSTKTLTAPLCDPYTSTVKGVVIDAAILALHGSFLVDNWRFGGTTGSIYLYGTIAQNYRGAVGTHSGTTLDTGYAKYYVFDSRLQYVQLPHYLTPSSSSWSISSSAVSVTTSCPKPWPKPYGISTGSAPTAVTPTGLDC